MVRYGAKQTVYLLLDLVVAVLFTVDLFSRSFMPESIEPVVAESLSGPLNTENAGNVMNYPGRSFGAMVNTAYNVRQHTLCRNKS